MAADRLRLRGIQVSGFKSLADFRLMFPDDLTVVIGANGAGKSSLLQVLSFVRYFANGEPHRFFEDRGWTEKEVVTSSKPGNTKGIITINMSFRRGKSETIIWMLSWDSAKNQLLLEFLFVIDENKTDEDVAFVPIFLPESDSWKKTPQFRHIIEEATHGTNDKDSVIPSFISPPGSAIKMISSAKGEVPHSDTISDIAIWATEVLSLELMNPSAMRGGSRSKASDIGPRGERLASFLASLSNERKARIVSRLERFYPIESLHTVKKKAGWVDLRIQEAYAGFGAIGAGQMSDGFMRLLGLAAIPEMRSDVQLVLLDEVENGIEPHILPDFIRMIAEESEAQLIVTSHSPILANHFDPRQIAFMCRDERGRSIASPLSEIEPLVRGMEYLGPGEAWANTDMATITEAVRKAKADQERQIRKMMSESIAKSKDLEPR